ncbi:PPK2 family polyphosphate kinase [Burkholderia thailandensis]|uniref:Polyphosphate kinase 2 family protein n=1 Tax=Burkholderia thailandensis TaxID=57975 RepID=A0AAW9CVE9_BURTH|nr:PPK2 family polyphosphate kinase [Burkholderia thailandensis]AHI64568.1 polyphosphate kinase 2 family protein [Burkholderia thailandensis H0587]AIP62718.1 polyphosphate kinase [Burkholderia thailandensis]AJY28063.1 polyphosphate kinase 2 family protein [Burkholderia thailandensis 34]AOI53309.1 polyphosphate kinase [Burkholderia thailandensis]AOJ52331.1 polyphosphate kinase [Burkholderia thailandensis]
MAKQPSLDDYRVPYHTREKETAAFTLDAFDPAAKPFSSGSKETDRERLSAVSMQLDTLQDRLHTQQWKRMLLVLQGMDTSGKDGTVRAVFREVDPLGLRIVSFKSPTPVELAHDFLWRVHAQAPAAGELAIFNRSHYEDVLVPRVLGAIDKTECERRYRQIRQFEEMLVESGATIVKCFLHISKNEQRDRLQARVDDPSKHWKFDISDLDARKHWDAYQAAYRDALAATSAEHAPWYVIPADSKTHRNVMIAELLLQVLTGMKLDYPPGKPELAGVRIQ